MSTDVDREAVRPLAPKAKVWIDGRDYAVDPSRNLLDVCLSLGFDLPYFCWHPALGSVGACRQCAVKQYSDEHDERGRLVMACMTPAADGTRISIADQEARTFRSTVIEWLMVNHPHDCPVCDEGGECHLQDMTVMTGHNYRRFKFNKRTYRNQDLGPLINHEMNRCIQCYRCVRFYNDHAGATDLQAHGAHDHVYFGRHQDGVLESEFSGNLVEICPTGVFTDKSLKGHFTRKWDLQTAPSICVHCSLGCNTTPGERYGSIRRMRARYHGKVNGYFLCDRGRYGYEFTNHERRLRTPMLPKGDEVKATGLDRQAALERCGQLCQPTAQLIGIGSPRASLEANFALQSLVGAEFFYQGTSASERQVVDLVVDQLMSGAARTPPLREVERCDTVFVLGEDVANSAPMLGLAVRQAIQSRRAEVAARQDIVSWHDAAVREAAQGEMNPLFIASSYATRLDGIAAATYRAAPADIARLGFAVAHALDPEQPAVADLDSAARDLAADIARALGRAQRPLVLSGTSCGSTDIVRATGAVAEALERRCQGRAGVVYALPECNSLGLALLGGGTLEQAIDAVEGDGIDTLLILENDLYRRARAEDLELLLSAARHVIVIDHIAHDTAARADVVLPSGTFAESDGTLVNNEGRAQRSYRVFVPEGEIREAWRWLVDIARASGRADSAPWQTLDELTRDLATGVFGPLSRSLPSADLRLADSKLPRAQHRYSGRTAIHASRDVHEPKPPDDPDTPLSFSMEGYGGTTPAHLISEFWSPGWNSIQSLNRFQEEIAGPLRDGDPGVRLIEPQGPSEGATSAEIPEAFERREREWRLVPAPQVFGSEELSALAPGIAELSAQPSIALCPGDAASLGLEEGDLALVEGDRLLQTLPLILDHSLPPGLAAIPAGLATLPLAHLPSWVTIEAAQR